MERLYWKTPSFAPSIFSRHILHNAGIPEQSMEARNRVGIGFVVPARQATQAGRIDSLESIPGLFKRFKIPPHYKHCMNRQVYNKSGFLTKEVALQL